MFVSNAASADVPSAQVAEVKHLLDFVKSGHCVINRNGSEYPADEAVSHIRKKYDYFRDDIRSTEDFIALSASKSTMSGDYYTVICAGKKMIRTQDWLMAELRHFRAEKNNGIR
jgi:hypothetical protein